MHDRSTGMSTGTIETPTTAPAAPHSRLAKLFHWGFIVVFAYGLAKQVDEVEELADPSFLQQEFVFAGVFLLILLIRFIYMRSTRPSALPDHAQPQIRNLARLAHLGMYLSLALLALSGIAIGALYKGAMTETTVFAFVLWSHEAFYWTSLSLIGLHIAGALYHRQLRDGVWDAMVPFLREKD